MARTRLPQQQSLISDVWRISTVREDIELLLAHVVRLQSEAIALAAAYGAKHPELATLADVSRQRIGQLVDQVDITDLSATAIHRQVEQVEEWPADVMSALTRLERPGDWDDPERRELLRRQTAIVHGQEEADRRHKARSDFLASLNTDPDRRARIDDDTASARRTIYGSTDA